MEDDTSIVTHLCCGDEFCIGIDGQSIEMNRWWDEGKRIHTEVGADVRRYRILLAIEYVKEHWKNIEKALDSITTFVNNTRIPDIEKRLQLKGNKS